MQQKKKDGRMKTIALSHRATVITKASSAEMPQAKATVRRLEGHLRIPNPKQAGKKVHFSELPVEKISSKLIVKFQKGIAQIKLVLKDSELDLLWGDSIKHKIDITAPKNEQKQSIMELKAKVESLTQAKNSDRLSWESIPSNDGDTGEYMTYW